MIRALSLPVLHVEGLKPNQHPAPWTGAQASSLAVELAAVWNRDGGAPIIYFAGCNSSNAQAYSNDPSNPLKLVDRMVRFRIPASVRNASPRLILICLSTVGLALFAAVSRAQTPDEVIVSDTALVRLNVGVVDQRGHVVTNLSAGDFAVFEDGVRRPIVSFEPTDAPFSLVMMLDTSGSTINFRQQINQAALRFLDALSPEDRVAVVDFNGKGAKLDLPFTTDRGKIAYAISITLQTGKGNTPLYDALKYSLKELSHEGKRRKAIVVLTDGLDTEARNGDRAVVSKASESDLPTAIKAETSSQVLSVLNDADRQGVTIFPLALPSGDPKRLPLPDPAITAMYGAARTRLQLLADRTGGRLHEIKRLDQLSILYAQVAADLRTLYSISYQAPNPGVRDGKWRAIRVEVARADLLASTKPGYYAK